MESIKTRLASFKILHGKQCLPNLDTWESWKADQIRVFFLYLMIPALHGYLIGPCFKVVCKFHWALILLFRSTISENELVQAEELLKQVYFSVSDETVWDRSFCTLNMHDMIHLPNQVRIFGALAFHSGFICETGAGKAKLCKL